jgi:hypothetical protein
MDEPALTGSLQLQSGHSSGHVSVSWARLEGLWVAITGGSDGKIVARHPRQAQELKSATNNDKAPIQCLTITQDNRMAATGDEKGYVRVSPPLVLLLLPLLRRTILLPKQVSAVVSN